MTATALPVSAAMKKVKRENDKSNVKKPKETKAKEETKEMKVLPAEEADSEGEGDGEGRKRKKPPHKRALPEALLSAVFDKASLQRLYQIYTTPETMAKYASYRALTQSGLRVYTERIPSDDSTASNNNSPVWSDIVPVELHRLMNFYSLSLTTAMRRTRLRRLISEYKYKIEYAVPGDGGGKKYSLPQQIVNSVLPYWFDWAFEAYDCLIMFGYAPTTFILDDSIIEGHEIPVPKIIQPDCIQVQVNQLGTGLRYELLGEAHDFYGDAYLIVDKLPVIGHSYDFEEFRDDQVDIPAIQTNLAKQLAEYRRYKRIVEYDIAQIAIATCRPIITQIPPTTTAKEQSIIKAANNDREIEFKLSGDVSFEEAGNVAVTLLPLVTKRAIEPRGPGKDLIYANQIELRSGQQLAGMPQTKDFSRDEQKHRIDAIVSRLAGYPDVRFGPDAFSPASSSSSSKSGGQSGGSASTKISGSSGGKLSAAMSGTKPSKAAADIDAEIGGSRPTDGSTCISMLEDLLTIAWNIVFAGQNAQFAFEFLYLMNLYYKEQLSAMLVKRIKAMAAPHVHILLPGLPEGLVMGTDMFDVMGETKAIWPLAHGITPRSWQRTRKFMKSEPEMNAKKPPPPPVTKPASSSSSSSKK